MMEQFNIKRIGSFIYRDIILLKGAILTTLSVASAIFFIVFLFSLRGDHQISSGEFMSIFGKFYIALGVLFIFSTFKEAHNQKSNHLYFSLPVSSYERIAAAWLSTFVVYTLVFSILGFLVGQITIILGSMFSETNFHLLPIFSESYWQLVKVYFVIQPVFLYGAIAFNKNRVGKTLLVVVLLVFGLIVLNMMLFGMLNYGYDVFSGEGLASEAFDKTGQDFSGMGKGFFMGIFVPLMLLASYFKIVEKEV
ncbi:hypothetical protein [Aquimarina sp. Aq78]|uniref:hypothetical protein n=1 Tax=Aquimarina sp. Aq78 TaxID=1191889 RepID=UPI00131BDBB8|nr:hypothetical protein [Aquimarina sp. Aq78]